MVNKNSISIIVPALNEEKNLEAAVTTILTTVEKIFDEYEIIIFNDGSTDKTGEIADTLTDGNKNIRVFHNKTSQCLGGVYKQGRKIAKMTYLMLVNGKNDIATESLDKIFALREKYDMVIPYTLNFKERPVIRVFFSKSFVGLLNTIFCLNLKYFNHYVLHRKELINSIDIKTDSYAFQAEALIKLIKSGYTYTEVGVTDKFEKGIKTKAFRINNIREVFLFFLRMIYEYYFTNKFKSK